MDFITAVKTCLSKYAVFQGRASRSEFWWFELFLLLVALAVPFIVALLFGGVMTEHMSAEAMGETGHGWGMMWGVGGAAGAIPHLVNLALFLPALGVTVRRLHDVGRSGWWVLLMAVPLIGFLVLLFWFVQPSEPRANAHGPQPLPALPAA
ncbi:DUF805 domain-containing protein [Xanthobacter sediminis]|uniref:DUF805 domain-containing protein n=1 Tax=Xanthobacter sediminis TaxID=3119926 RepID=UPI0037263E48